MGNIFEHMHSFFVKSFQRLSELLYVPSQTGSHDLGEQYLGDVASTYVDHKNFPEAARSPFRGVVLPKRN
jgi:hypothetical protein